jgi:hypothetical protein
MRLSAVLVCTFVAGPAFAADYHVDPTGNDGGQGSSAAPWKTIQKAADTMQPGDTCTVHAGTYREWVKPARGGTSESARIVYRAAQGQQVSIKGSEAVTSWTSAGTNVWKAVVPNSTFGSFNPYSSTISGSYMTYGQSYHQGDVYLNGEPLSEVLSQGETSAAKTWYAQVDATNTTIYANFGGTDPNGALAEINVRKYVFAPSVTGLGYITIDGFTISHGATNWAPPDAATQEGMVATSWGIYWNILNNVITDSKNVCLISGMVSGGGSQAIDRVGNHVISGNTIRRCGEAGIAGSHGLPASVIAGNLIEEINPARHFGGYETAAIKIHSAIDVVIAGNVIRRVHSPRNGSSNAGIWLDWQAQGSRITGNVIYDIDDTAIELEADHGPNLLDNNVLVGNDSTNTLWDVAESTTYVHNLFVNFSWSGNGDGRTPSYFTPHTTQAKGNGTITNKENKYYNNIHVKKGLGVGQSSGFASDNNVYYGGATKTGWGDAKSVVHTGFDAAFAATDLADGVTVTWKADTAPTDVACPLITRAFIGTAALTGQGIENHDGSPITIDKDMTGAARSATQPTAGPLEASSATNTVTLRVGVAGAPGSGGSSGTGGSGGGSTGSGGSARTDGGGTAGSKAGATGTGGGAAAAGTDAIPDEEVTDQSGGCGCRVAGGVRAADVWLAALAALLFARRRRYATV